MSRWRSIWGKLAGSYKLATLLDVIEFTRAKQLAQAAGFVARMEEALRGEDASASQSTSSLKLLGASIRMLSRVADELEIPSLKGSAERLEQKILDGGLSPEVARHQAKEIGDIFRDELEDVLFLVVESRDRAYYENPPLSSAAASKFPRSDEELWEAGKCFALGRSTASVMHAMRALEEPLNRMRQAVRLPRKPQSWGRSLGEIEDKLKTRRPTTQQAQARQQALTEAALEFRGFKDAWRNYAMHGQQSYNREQSERILRHVKSFVSQVAVL